MNDIHRHLQAERRLHKQLNSARPPEDLAASYERLRAAQQEMQQAAHQRLDTAGHVLSMHDAWVRDFRERRHGNTWRTRFCADVIAHKPPAEDAGPDARWSETGYVRVEFDADVLEPARALSGCEIHTFLVDENTRQMGFLVHNKTGGMDVIVVPFSRLDISKGPVRTWSQLVQQERAVGPWRPAQVVIAGEPDQDPIAARWYDNGYLEVDPAGDGQWQDWIWYASRQRTAGQSEADHATVKALDASAQCEVPTHSRRRDGRYAPIPHPTPGKRKPAP